MTLSLTDSEERLEGILSMSDLARKLMDQNPSVLSAAKTPYMHIAETLDGQILTKDKDGVFEKGKKKSIFFFCLSSVSWKRNSEEKIQAQFLKARRTWV